ncbi:MAG: B12-binding domain-containing radical SAM protein [Promethearchaeota archaeon]
MDLLLIDPPRRYWGFAGGGGFFAQPLGLAHLAGFLDKNKTEVGILDCNMEKIDWDGLRDEIKKRDPWIVGVTSSMTCFVPDSFRCLELAKEINPEILTLGGGLQVSLTPDESFEKCKSLDLIVRGDGEFACYEAISELRRKTPHLERIDGLSFRRDGEIVHNKERPPISDLDELPFPAWHLLPMDKYRLPVIPPKWGNFAVVVTTRGCPYNCKFCSPKIGQKPYREMSAGKAVDMIEELNSEYATKAFWVNDLSFNVNRSRTEQFLNEIIERGLKIRMAIDGTRTDLLVRDKDLIPKMKKAGVFMVNLGVESDSNQDLELYNKETTAEKAKEAVRLLKKNKIHAWAFMMVGNWNHDEEDIHNILDFAKELDPLVTIFALVTPVPGTEFYEKMTTKGLIEDLDWSNYDFAHPVMRTEHLSRDQILELLWKVYLGFYKRPRKIIKHAIFGDAFSRYTYKTSRGMGQMFVRSTRQLKEGEL